ncbi:MAG: DUF4412 domain-containing protein [Verrucomicrobiota bacterium]
MKYFLPHWSFGVALALLASTSILRAQMPGGGSGPMNAAMLKMFGKNTNFTAKADVRMLDNSQKETMSMSFAMALAEGKMRAELDMSQIKNAMMTPQLIAQMKQMGADRTVYIVRPDLKANYVIYPALKAYALVPLSNADKQALGKEPKIQKTPLGKETIDGHPCVKNKVVVTDDKGQVQEATVWNATDLKDFAIQMQIKESSANTIMKFKEVQLVKPNAKEFEPPAGFTKYQTIEEIQQLMMQKMMKAPAK